MAHRVTPRAEWRAAAPKGKLTRQSLPVKELYCHHSAVKAPADPFAAARQVQQIAFGRGFTDTSYNYLIHPDGTILEGRGDFIGAHTAKRNAIAIGICFLGNYSQEKPTAAQLDAARWLRKHLVDTGRLTANHVLKGHRDNPASPSECPGNNLYPRLPELLLHPAPQEDEMNAQQDARLARVELRAEHCQQMLEEVLKAVVGERTKPDGTTEVARGSDGTTLLLRLTKKADEIGRAVGLVPKAGYLVKPDTES